MKQLFLCITVFLAIKIVCGDTISLANFAEGFSTRGREILQDRVTGQFSNFTVAWDLQSNLNFFRRQEQCVNAGYVPCASEAGCCPAGDNCVPDGCCSGSQMKCGSNGCYDPQTSICCENSSTACLLGQVCVDGGCCPQGQPQRCGSTKCYDPTTNICCQNSTSAWGCPTSDKCCSNGFCYDPASEQCCDNGSCPQDDTCCANECCRSIAYCGSNGYCTACPLLATATATTSAVSTILTTTTVTITQISESAAMPAFTCLPITVTNAANATLELGTGCKLSYIPPSSATASTNPIVPRTAVPTPAAADAPLLRPRQLSCSPITTTTTTTTVVTQTTSVTTSSVTVFESSEPGFSCSPMTVTNQAGDVLSLDKSCALGFSAATTSATSSASSVPSGTGSGGSAGAQTSQKSAAESGLGRRMSSWGALMVALLGILL